MIADRMVIINKGSTIVEGEVKELLKTDTLKVIFEVNDINASKSVLESTKWYKKIESITGNNITVTSEQNEISEINRLLVEKGIAVSAVIPKRSLEEYFLKITSEAN
jgi:ABC-type multidrug transport system ATPase subunit